MTEFDPSRTPLEESELRYAATVRCACGAGLAYFKGELATKPWTKLQWDCADVLTGRAIPKGQPGSKIHSGPFPFVFFEIKSEDQPSANGRTTRSEVPHA